MSIKLVQTVYEPIPTGEYPAKITNIEEKEGQFGPQLQFTFEIPYNDEKRNLTGWCSMKFSAKSKLYEWAMAAFGGTPIDREYTFDSDDLIGKRVTLVVVSKNGDNGEYNKIESVRPYRKAAPQPPPPPYNPDEDW